MARDYRDVFEDADQLRIDQYGYATIILKGISYTTLKALSPPMQRKVKVMWAHRNTNQVVKFLEKFSLKKDDPNTELTRDEDMLALIRRMKVGPLP